jgi:hypothetical protein
MSPTSLEEAIKYFQNAAGSLQKSTLRLDESLRAINDVLLRSCEDEIIIPIPVSERVHAENLGPGIGVKLVTGVGIVFFRYEGEEVLALGLRYEVIEPETDLDTGETLDHVRVWNWIPLVSLPGFGAPKPAARRLRVWAANHIDQWVRAFGEKIAQQTQSTEAATRVSKQIARAVEAAEGLRLIKGRTKHSDG